MKKEIKKLTNLKKLVRLEKAKTLKRIQGDMVVQDDMEVCGHCERTRSNPANYFARSADKNLLGCSRLTGLRLSVAEFHSFTLKP